MFSRLSTAIVTATAGAAFAFGLALAAAGPAGADYRESFDAGADPGRVMAGKLLLGEKDGWSGELSEGQYRLSNADKANALRYFFVYPKQRAASLEVTVEGRFDGDNAGAGLLYGVDREAGTYYAFVVAKGGKYAVFERTPNGIKRIAAGGNDAINREGVNALSIRFEGNTVSHFINDAKMMGFGSKNPVEGAVGIVAIDRGAYSFDDFAFTE